MKTRGAQAMFKHSFEVTDSKKVISLLIYQQGDFTRCKTRRKIWLMVKLQDGQSTIDLFMILGESYIPVDKT
jgi:hypothetical protein